MFTRIYTEIYRKCGPTVELPELEELRLSVAIPTNSVKNVNIPHLTIERLETNSFITGIIILLLLSANYWK